MSKSLKFIKMGQCQKFFFGTELFLTSVHGYFHEQFHISFIYNLKCEGF